MKTLCRVCLTAAITAAAGFLPAGCFPMPADAEHQGGVWIMRHGEDGGPYRVLTDQGRRQVREAAKPFARIEGLTIWTSPQTRCRQTAEIVLEAAPNARLETVDWLDYRNPLPADWRQRLPDGPVLLVTHQPVVRAMLRELSAERTQPIGHAFVYRISDPPAE